MNCLDCGKQYVPDYNGGSIISNSCPNCGSYRSQPNPLHSEMEMRNMPAPGEDDMGGNPLQEGILGQTDGGWKNRMKRDESFASVKTASDDPWDDDDELEEYNPYNADEDPNGLKERFIVTPDGQLLRSRNLAAKGPLHTFHEDIAADHGMTNGEHLQHHSLGEAWGDGRITFPQHASPHGTAQLQALVNQHFPGHFIPGEVQQSNATDRFQYNPNQDKRELEVLESPPTQQPWQNRPRMDRNEGLIRGGSTRDKMYLPWSLNTERIANDFDVEQIIPDGPASGEVTIDGHDNPLILQHDDPSVIDNAKNQLEKSAGLLSTLVGGGAGFMLGGPMGALRGAQVGNLVSNALAGSSKGEGGGESMNAPGAAPDAQAPVDPAMYSSVHAILSTPFEHPSSNPGYDDTDDPENVDQHEFNDGDHTNLTDDIDEGGGSDHLPLDSEAGQAFQDALPALLKYHDSPESGHSDPSIARLVELLDAHHPGILDHEADDNDLKEIEEAKHLLRERKSAVPGGVPGIGMQPGAVTPGMQNLQPAGPGNNVNPMSQGSCPHCGAMVTPGQGICPQCNSAVGPAIPGQSPAAIPQPPAGPNPPMAQNMPVMAANQGPHNPQQFQMVADYLKQQGKEHMIPDLIAHPDQYGDILAEIQGKQQPPVPDPDQGPPPAMPAMPPGGAPPGDPSAAGGMPPMMGNTAASDPVTPPCPSCDSHTTGMITDSGMAQCSNCNHKWQTSVETQGDTTPVQPKASAHDNLHNHGQGVPAADQHAPDDPEHDVNPGGQWATQDGQPLVVGQQYEMYSGQYNVPDVVQIEDIKPDSISYKITGEYGLEHRTELSRQEAQMDGTYFTPTDGGEDPLTPDQGEVPTDPTAKLPAFAKVAGRKFTPMEQREFIDEPGVARNSDKLRLEGTHYEDSPSMNDDFFLFGL